MSALRRANASMTSGMRKTLSSILVLNFDSGLVHTSPSISAYSILQTLDFRIPVRATMNK